MACRCANFCKSLKTKFKRLVLKCKKPIITLWRWSELTSELEWCTCQAKPGCEGVQIF